MKIEVIPLTDFQHDDIRAREGHPLDIEEAIAADLARTGLVRIPALTAPAMRGARALGVQPGKVRAGGVVAPQSSSPAARASASKTANESERGAMQTDPRAR